MAGLASLGLAIRMLERPAFGASDPGTLNRGKREDVWGSNDASCRPASLTTLSGLGLAVALVGGSPLSVVSLLFSVETIELGRRMKVEGRRSKRRKRPEVLPSAASKLQRDKEEGGSAHT